MEPSKRNSIGLVDVTNRVLPARTKNEESDGNSSGVGFVDGTNKLKVKYNIFTSRTKENACDESLLRLRSPLLKRRESTRSSVQNHLDLECKVKLKKMCEYTEEIIDYMLAEEKEIRVPVKVLKIFAEKYKIVANWLVLVQHKLDLPAGTLYVAASLMIATITTDVVDCRKLQILACAALWVAAKFLSCKKSVPEPADIIKFSNNVITEKEVILAEQLILKTNEFKICYLDPLTFVSYYLAELDVGDKKMNITCYYLLDIMFVDMCTATKAPSLLAAAAVYTALFIYKKEHLWAKHEGNRRFRMLHEVENVSRIMLKELELTKDIAARNKHGPFQKFKCKKFGALSLLLSSKQRGDK